MRLCTAFRHKFSWVSLEKAYVGRDWPLNGHALCLLGPRNKLRVFCAELLEHKLFEPLVLLMIAVSSVIMVIQLEPGYNKESPGGILVEVTTTSCVEGLYDGCFVRCLTTLC